MVIGPIVPLPITLSLILITGAIKVEAEVRNASWLFLDYSISKGLSSTFNLRSLDTRSIVCLVIPCKISFDN